MYIIIIMSEAVFVFLFVVVDAAATDVCACVQHVCVRVCV